MNQELEQALAQLEPLEPHPLVWPHTVVEVESSRRVLRHGTPDAAAKMAHWLAARRERIVQADYDESNPLVGDPFEHGFELPHWRDADWLLGWRTRTGEFAKEVKQGWQQATFTGGFAPGLLSLLTALVELVLPVFYILILLGGNRSGKSEYAAKRVVQSALAHRNSLVVCLSEDIDASRTTQQRLIWKYLPRHVKALNDKKNHVFNVRYTVKGGFTEETLVLPNGSVIKFKTYNQEPGSIEGWMLGAKGGRAVGMWMDESASTGWFEAGQRRCRYCGAMLIWSFTPIKGMTPAIKQAVGKARTVLSLPAELLSEDQRHVEDCPKGHMPYVQLARTDGAAVLYFFSQFNPFGTAAGPFYDAVKSLCRNTDGTPKASTHIKRIAHGYTEDVAGIKYPAFGSRHLLEVNAIPEDLTIYHFIDPHGSRPYAQVWIGVAPGRPREGFVLRDWPDERTYGEWAVPTMRETSGDTRKGWDGDKGPAQRELGWGIADYKKLWQRTETVLVPTVIREFAANAGETAVFNAALLEDLLRQHVKYPWHRAIIRRAINKGENLDELREHVRKRFMDARFCHSKQAGQNGLTCLQWEFEKPVKDAHGRELWPAMRIWPASGQKLEHGESLVSDLLAWDVEKDFVPHINAPQLYVSEECTQVRWMFENFTGRAGEEGACKEWSDLLRHYAEEKPPYIKPGPLEVLAGGGY